MRPTPFLDGFRAGVKPPPEELEFDSASLTELAPMDKPRTNEEFAEHYRCSVRTICRMKALGIDLRDPTAVTIHLVQLQKVSISTLERATEILEELS